MSYFCRSRNTILCSRLPYAVAHSLFFASHPRCSLVPEAVSHRGRIYTVVLGRVPRNRKHLEARGSSRDPSPKGHNYQVVFLWLRHVSLLQNYALAAIISTSTKNSGRKSWGITRSISAGRASPRKRVRTFP